MITIRHGQDFLNRLRDYRLSLPEGSDDTLLILPTNRWRHRWKETLIEQSPTQTFSSSYLTSYNRLIYDMVVWLQHVSPQEFRKKYVTPSLKISLVKEVLKKLKGHYKYFTYLNDSEITLGTVKKINNLIEELVSARFSAEEFQKINSFSSKNLETKHQDISKIFLSFEQDIAQNFTDRLLSHNDILKFYGKKDFGSQFLNVRRIVFAGFDVFTKLMNSLVGHFSSFCEHVVLEINGDLFQNRIISHTKEDLKYLEEHHQVVFESALPKKNVFLKQEKVMCYRGSFQTFEEEIKAIFSKIYKLKEEDGIAFHKMVIAYPNLDAVAEQIRFASKSYGLPINITSGFQLIEAPITQFVLLLMRLCKKRVSYLDIIRFFEAPYTEGLISFDTYFFTKKYASYSSVLTISSFLETISPHDSKPIYEGIFFLNGLSNKNFDTVFDFLENLYHIFEKVDILQKLLPKNVKMDADENELYERDIRAFYSLSTLLKQTAVIYESGVNSLSFELDKFYSSFIQEIEGKLFQLREVKNYGVHVMPLLETRSEYPSVIFLAGLNQSVFPKSLVPETIFTDDEKLEMGFRKKAYPVEEDRHLLHSVFDKKIKYIFLSDTTKNSETDSPSILIKELKESAFFIENWGTEDFRLMSYIDKKKEEKALKKITYGFIYKEKGETPLKKRFMTYLFSVRQLQDFVDCPYRFFLGNALDLKRVENIHDEMDNMDRGNLIHRLMAIIYANNPNLWEMSIEEQHRKIDAVLKVELEQVAIDKKSPKYLTILELKNQASKFYRIVEVDQREYGNYRPTLFEWRFGERKIKDVFEDKNSTDKNLILKQKNLSLKICGKIDRIDFSKDGNALVLDYKSGGNFTAKEFKEGKNIQLPTYILAAQKLINGGKKIIGGLLFKVGSERSIVKEIKLADLNYDFKKNKFAGRFKNQDNEEITFNEYLKTIEDKLLNNYHCILEGTFPLEPQDTSINLKKCMYCNYKKICRIREKMQRKL